jgi:hypothetical protein
MAGRLLIRLQAAVNASAQGQVASMWSHWRRAWRLRPGGQVVEPEPHGVRLGVGEAAFVVEGQEAEPGVEVGGEVGGQHPRAVDRPGLGGQVLKSHGLVGADAVFDHGVVARFQTNSRCLMAVAPLTCWRRTSLASSSASASVSASAKEAAGRMSN